MAKQSRFDVSKFINPSQVGGIDAYTIDEGEGRGVRALAVNTGGGLRYRVLPDRGLDIDQAFFNQHSLTFLSHKGVTPPTRALDRGLDWLKGFPVGLLTSCGPSGMGAPCNDQGEEVGLHGPHSNTAAAIESVIQPDPRAGRNQMMIVGRVRTGAFYGPCYELRRTIVSTLGENWIDIEDEILNAGNTRQPHGWLLHINLGYPLIDEGAVFCYDASRVEPVGGSAESAAWFSAPNDYKRCRGPMKEHRGPNSFVGYIYPRADRGGMATVGVVNRKLKLGLAIHYNVNEFTRCTNWQHWGLREYVAALEPCTGSVEGRDKDRKAGILPFLAPGERKTYRYRIEAVADREGLEALLALNG